VVELYQRVRAVMASLPGYRYEHIFIDNASSDHTLAVLKYLAQTDQNVKVIANSRNFGPVRSPMHALQEARGDVVIGLASDLQDPPELIADFIKEWEKGVPIVIGVKTTSDENPLVYWAAKPVLRAGEPTFGRQNVCALHRFRVVRPACDGPGENRSTIHFRIFAG